MMETNEQEVASFDFRKFGKLTLTDKSLKGTIYSFQKAKQPQQQSNTIAGNPSEVRVEHQVDATLDRISRVNVNEGLLLGPVVYVWDAFVVIATLLLFFFIGNTLSFISWARWLALSFLYGIFWGHHWVKTWVNFHFTLDGAPYRILVEKSRMAEIERFVGLIRNTRATGFATAAPLHPEVSRGKQIQIGLVVLSIATLVALALTCCVCGKSAHPSATKASKQAVKVQAPSPESSWLEGIEPVSKYPELEMKILRKAARLSEKKLKRMGASGDLLDSTVRSSLGQIQSSIKQLEIQAPKEMVETALNKMYQELDQMIQ